MPTAEAMEKLNRAIADMKAAQEAHLTFIERPDRTFSNEESLRNKVLLDRVNQSIANYWQAFEQARKA